MKDLKISRVLLVGVLMLGLMALCGNWIPASMSTTAAENNMGACCNNDDTDQTCATSVGAGGTCETPYSLAKGTGDGTKKAKDYCKGITYCNLTAGSWCSNDF